MIGIHSEGLESKHTLHDQKGFVEERWGRGHGMGGILRFSCACYLHLCVTSSDVMGPCKRIVRPFSKQACTYCGCIFPYEGPSVWIHGSGPKAVAFLRQTLHDSSSMKQSKQTYVPKSWSYAHNHKVGYDIHMIVIRLVYICLKIQ